jgi:hypothetical protein
MFTYSWHLIVYLLVYVITSPPTFNCFAFFPVIKPFDVETIAIPNPLRILGSKNLNIYVNLVLILWISLITDSLVSLSYFKAILIEPWTVVFKFVT